MPSFKPQWQQIILLTLIPLCLYIAYYPSLNGDFIWDDDNLVNEDVKSWQGIQNIWTPHTQQQFYPMTFSSLWLNYRIWGLDAPSFRKINLLIHCLCALLLWCVLLKLEIPHAWLITMAFALHPVHVESVAWIAERKNTLSGLFYMASLLCYLYFYEDSKKYKYLLSLGFYALAMLSKTVVASLPVAILIIIWWKHNKIGKREILHTLPFFLVGIPLGLLTVYMEKIHVGAVGAEWQFSFLERITIASRAWWHYIVTIAFPSNLCFNYFRWQVSAAHLLPWVLFVLAATAVVASWHFREKIGRTPLACLLFFTVTISPALGFFDIYPMRYYFVADHWQYLASLGSICALAYGYQKLVSRAKPIAVTVGGVLVLSIFSYITWNYSHVYKNNESLMLDILTKNPQSWLARNQLGAMYLQENKLDEALEQYQKLHELRPDHESYYNMAIVYLKKGELDLAQQNLQMSISRNSEYYKAYMILGTIYDQQKNFAKSLKMHHKAVELNPKSDTALNNLGSSYCAQERYQEAIPFLQQALVLNPKNASAHRNLAGAYFFGEKMLDQAILHYEKSVRLLENQGIVHFLLAKIYFEKKLFSLAIQECEKAQRLKIQVDPRFLQALKPYR